MKNDVNDRSEDANALIHLELLCRKGYAETDITNKENSTNGDT